MNFFQDDLIYQCKNVNSLQKYLIKSIYTWNSAVWKANAKHPPVRKEFASVDCLLLPGQVRHLAYLSGSAETGAGPDRRRGSAEPPNRSSPAPRRRNSGPRRFPAPNNQRGSGHQSTWWGTQLLRRAQKQVNGERLQTSRAAQGAAELTVSTPSEGAVALTHHTGRELVAGSRSLP